jgi:DNA-binding protein HU-beta
LNEQAKLTKIKGNKLSNGKMSEFVFTPQFNLKYYYFSLNNWEINTTFASQLKNIFFSQTFQNQQISMRKADLVVSVSEKTGVPKVDVLVAMEAFFKEVKTSLAEGENVYIRGFGSFIIKKRAKKIGRHIKRNVAIEIPEHFIPAFKPAKIFVEQVKSNVTSLPSDEGMED